MSINNSLIYIIDDDEAVSDSLQWSLQCQGYQSKIYNSPLTFLRDYNPYEKSGILLDIRMPSMDGIELQEKLLLQKKEEHFPTPIIFMTGHGDIELAVKTLKKGAIDFIEKPFKNELLCQILDDSLDKAHKKWMKTKNLLQKKKILSQLTTREYQVLKEIVLGHLNKQIAGNLGISIKTVEAHRGHLMAKLGIRRVADAIKIFLSVQKDS